VWREARKSWAEINPELVREPKRLRRRSPNGHQRSLREVAAELAKLGFMNERGVMFSAQLQQRACCSSGHRNKKPSSLATEDGHSFLANLAVDWCYHYANDY
jgi:hypothetical protein